MKAGIESKNIVVIGLGMTGLSVVNHLLRQDDPATIKVIDTRKAPPGREELPPGVALHVGGWNKEWLFDADLIVVSPGVALASAPLQEALLKGIEIVGDIELFARELSIRNQDIKNKNMSDHDAKNVPAKVIGITGSNGKSTVTCLLGEMAKAAMIDVGVGGNIGFAALDMLKSNHALYILELSSFQLETTASLNLSSAVFLNLSEDHMDRYDGMDEYLDAKLRIFKQAEILVCNRDDLKTIPSNSTDSISFGFTKGDYTLTYFDEMHWLTAKGECVMPVSEIALVGRHNVANCLAAMALADTVGIPSKAQVIAMRTYLGLPHRCQKVLTHEGVLWVNDSKATNPASTLAALDGLQLSGTLHLLVGGQGKDADFAPLKPILDSLTHTLYCYGQDKDALALLTSAPVIVETMQEAMDSAFKAAKSGDMVLLSPACASFDQFTNFLVRGETFAAYAKDIIMKAAQKRTRG